MRPRVQDEEAERRRLGVVALSVSAAVVAGRVECEARWRTRGHALCLGSQVGAVDVAWGLGGGRCRTPRERTGWTGGRGRL